ncbi:MAG: hypothetical protein Q7S45_02225 [Candidatus Curtissbacteria bacterium]|nr:hypothetical protein [Candidatus Curtissbacteria bacterium]
MKYIFFGKVHPERAALTLPETKGEVGQKDGDFKGTIKVLVILSQITVELDTTSKYHIIDLKNSVENFVHAMVDTYGYLKGYAYSVEILSVFIPETGHDEVFGIDVVQITEDEKNRPLNYNDALQLALKIPELYMVLKDLRDAIKRPYDTFFHCRRATETIAKYFTAARNEDTDWSIAIDKLKLDDEELKSIGRAGSGQRHGNYKSVTGSERVEIMMKTWRVVDSFIRYLASKNN